MAVIEGLSGEPAEPVSRGWKAAISLANLGLFMAYFGPLAVLMPNQVQAVAGQAHKVAAFGFVSGLGALVAVIANPLAGALSDRTTSWFGRRRPWVLGGAVASALALVLLASQPSIAGITAGWCLAQAGLNAMRAGIAACVPDRVPVPQRGAVSGWLGAPQCVGVVLAVILVSKVAPGSAGYLVLAVLTVALALPFVLAAQEQRLDPAQRPPFRLRAFLRSFLPSPGRYPDFGWAWLTRFLIVFGNSAAVLYLLYFLRDRVHYSLEFPGQTAEDGLVILLLVYTVVVVITAVVSGVVSDRGGWRRAPVVLSGGVMAIPAVMLALWSAWPVVLAGAAILGLGFGIYLSVDQALVAQVLPASSGHGRQRRSDSVW